MEETQKPHITGKGMFCRGIIFLVLFLFVFSGLNVLFQPVWYGWNCYDAAHSIYDEPENTIETVCLGASIMTAGVDPMRLYEDYGICAYNLGMEQQPMLASYYWLKEIERLQGESIKTVILDVSMLRRDAEKDFFRKGMDYMRFSNVKAEAYRDFTDGSLTEILNYIVPLFSYHSRWSELKELDFEKTDYVTKNYQRGYNYKSNQALDIYGSYDAIPLPSYYLNEEASQKELSRESLYYLQKIVSFCDDKGFRLVLIKTPGQYISANVHNAVQALADQYSLDFFDFNYYPLIEEIGFNQALDNRDEWHLNYYGAGKLTAWLGEYLTNECGATDVRGKEGFEFMDEQMEEYHTRITGITALKEETDVSAYIANAAAVDDYMVFVAVKDDAATSLTDMQRERFASIGLEKLSGLEKRDSYLAVIDGGNILCEMIEKKREGASTGSTTKEGEKEIDNSAPIIDPNEITMEEVRQIREEKTAVVKEESLSLVYKGQLPNKEKYELRSGGLHLGNEASIVIDGVEQAKKSRGINIVLYSKSREEIVASAVFDTYAYAEKDSADAAKALEQKLAGNGGEYDSLPARLKKLYFYNIRRDDEVLAAKLKIESGKDGLLSYLKGVINRENYAVFIAVKDEASNALGDEVRNELSALGLEKLAGIGFRDSYLAVIQAGEILYEECQGANTAVSYKGICRGKETPKGSASYSLQSAGMDAGNIASIKINKTEYSRNTRGINIVVWNTLTNRKVDSIYFDTYEIPARPSAGTEKEEMNG